jgi:hypothetical protein
MTYDSTRPADTETISIAPAGIRENFRALKEDAVVNAGTLNGYSQGNSSGNVALSNGTLCTNLNADKLDGQDGSYYTNLIAANLPLAGGSMTGALNLANNIQLTGKNSSGTAYPLAYRDGSNNSVLGTTSYPTVVYGSAAAPTYNNGTAYTMYHSGNLSINQSTCVPYSVNSGAVDTNGYANILSKASNSSLTVLATATPIVLTHPNGAQEMISSDVTITGMSSNGTYNIVKEYGASPSASINSITENIVSPSSPSSGDYWLNIGVKPYKPYKYNGSSWVATQFVKLGEATITSSVMGTPVSYAFNGKAIVKQTSVALSTNYTLSHNVGSQVKPPSGFLNNITGVGGTLVAGSNGYVIGMGAGNSCIAYSSLGLINNKTVTLYAGCTYLYITPGGGGYFTGADAVIYIERSF